MINTIKKTTIKLSVVAALALTPSAVLAATGAAVAEGSSESISAMMESPNVEQQINRINTGINLIRVNTDILERMPVSEDTQWVEKIITPLSQEEYKKVFSLKEIKEDPYYSTVGITNLLLGRVAMPMSPATAKLYTQLSVIYQNAQNGHKKMHLPGLYSFPDISSPKSYVTFPEDKKVDVIKVEAKGANLHNNVEDATISLVSEGLQEEINAAKVEYKQTKEEVANKKSVEGELEAWLKDDKNIKSPQRAEKQEALNVAKAEVEAAEATFDEKSDIYFAALEKGADDIEVNFDPSKVELAKKLSKLLDIVDNNAIRAGSLFAAATAHLAKNGIDTLSHELVAIQKAQALTTLVGNQKQFLIQRYKRMATGALMAIPNIGIGAYYATKQALLSNEYKNVVNKVLEAAEVAAEAEAEAKAAAEEAKAEAESK
jgi:tRNA pseudouridine-54 N-methylase